MSQPQWSTENIPDQSGKVVVVTGASSGIGKVAARVLAAKGAAVVLAVRNMAKGEGVAGALRRENSFAEVSVGELDLADLSSIEHFAESIARDFDRLDILINNAGVMMCPYSKTRDGFELQFGTNHLGHFALVGHLLPLLKKTDGSRLVMLSSLGHRGGDIDFADLHWEARRYKPGQAYADSKLANLYFTYELARKVGNAGSNPLVTAAHPGWTGTELQRHTKVFNFLNRVFAQDVEMGALPTLRAATDPEAGPGDYFGPAKHFEMHGPPVVVRSSDRSHDADAARELWMRSEELTGIRY